MSRRALLLIALLALVARVGYELAVRTDDGPVGALAGHLLGDERAYDRFARQVAEGGVERERSFYQAPAYAWMVGQLYRLWPPDPLPDDPPVLAPSPVHEAVFAGQHLLGVVLALMVAGLAARALCPRAGAVAGVLAALSGPVIFHEGMLLKASLSLVAFVLALRLWLDVLEGRGRAGRQVLLGLVLGGAVLLRGNLLLLLGLVVVSLVVPLGAGSRRLGAAALVLGAALVTMSPATIHNLGLGEFVLTTYQSGSNAAIGMPDSDDLGEGVIYAPLRAGRGDATYEETDAVALAEAAAGRRLSGPEISRWWWSVVRDRAASRPTVALTRAALKAVHLFHGVEVPDVKDWAFFARRTPWLATPLSDLWFVGPAALLGFVLLPWRRRPGLLVVRGGLVVVGVSLVLFYVMGRYRLTAAPCLWILAAGLVDRWLTLRRERPLRVAAEALAVVSLGALSLALPLPSDQGGDHVSWSNAATVARRTALEAEDPAEARAARDRAVAWVGRAIDIAPGFPAPRRQLCLILAAASPVLEPDRQAAWEAAWRLLLLMELTRTGQEQSGLASVDGPLDLVQDRALALLDAPGTAQREAFAGPLLGWACLAVAQELRATPEQLELALRLIDRSLAVDPQNAVAFVQRGLVLKRLGRLPEAEQSYRAALAAGVEQVELYNNLGNLLLELGRSDEAASWLERAVDLRPDDPRLQRNLERARAGG